jgi:hypothetical protein
MEQDALERRYDGPIPPADPSLAGFPPARARAVLFERLAAEAREQAVRRRLKRDFDGSERAAVALACYRAHGVAWRQNAKGGADRSAPPDTNGRSLRPLAGRKCGRAPYGAGAKADGGPPPGE